GSFTIEIEDRTTARFDRAIESAVYFCCLEALQNTAKYANATRATVFLENTSETLTFTVSDDGSGFDPAATPQGSGTQGMADRLAALDGTFSIVSAPGEGTTVVGDIPAQASGGGA
ncbi:MAG: ATP-binding protein, partial [Actinomycetota bacterium]|nr:ATP-binding protein [Actinomycetota bacterium]